MADNYVKVYCSLCWNEFYQCAVLFCEILLCFIESETMAFKFKVKTLKFNNLIFGK